MHPGKPGAGRRARGACGPAQLAAAPGGERKGRPPVGVGRPTFGGNLPAVTAPPPGGGRPPGRRWGDRRRVLGARVGDCGLARRRRAETRLPCSLSAGRRGGGLWRPGRRVADQENPDRRTVFPAVLIVAVGGRGQTGVRSPGNVWFPGRISIGGRERPSFRVSGARRLPGSLGAGALRPVSLRCAGSAPASSLRLSRPAPRRVRRLSASRGAPCLRFACRSPCSVSSLR